jgi:FMN-dependent NADH-azoreductase
MERDLPTTVLPVISDEWIEATHSDPSQWTPAHKQALSLSDTLVAELAAAGMVVIGAPMYDFSIPFPRKAWIDQDCAATRRLPTAPRVPKGLLAGRKVVVIISRGGAYGRGSRARKADFQEPYLRFILEFIGLTDVTFIHAENQARQADASLVTAAARIVEVATAENRQVSTQ